MNSLRNLITARRALWGLACLGLLVGANGALAHDNLSTPRLVCQDQSQWFQHDYLGFDVEEVEGIIALDGHVADCNNNMLTREPDTDIEWGQGGAILAVYTGSAFHNVPGTDMCYGGLIGHHGYTIEAIDHLGFGPALIVAADYARGPNGDPCGDGIIEPCAGPPAPSTNNFPVNVVEDIANDVVYQEVTGPNGLGCNPLDQIQRAAYTPGASTIMTMQFGHGADGTYIVLVQADLNVPAIPMGGHIWGH